MRVTVADCLEVDSLADAKIAACGDRLSEEVRSVSVADARCREDLDLISPDGTQMVLTGFLGHGDDTAGQCSMVRDLAGRCAALVVFYRDGSLNEDVVRTAEESGVLLIQAAGDARYSTVISEVMDRVLYGDNFRNSLISNTVYHLLDFEKHSSFQSAVKEAAVNNDFQLILLSEDFNPILTVETRHNATIADAIRLGRERKLADESQVYTMIDVNGVLTYWGPVSIGSDRYYMFIVDNEDSYTAGEITKLAEIIELAMGMWKYTPEKDAKSEFLKALIRGNKGLAYTIQDEAKIDSDDILSVFYSKGISKEAENRVFAEFEMSTDLEILKFAEKDETYGMIMKTDDSPRIRIQNECMTLFNSLKENKQVRVLHVTGLNGIEGAADAYKLIGESISFVQSVFPYKRVFTKYELTLVSNCMNIQIQGGFVRKNYVELLEPFKEAGEHKGRQLLETLETFVLDAGMNSSKTAEFMEIHTNTVQYRLKKINEMLGVEITANRVIPGLTVALALKRLERVVI